MVEIALVAFATFIATIGPFDVSIVFASLTGSLAPRDRTSAALKGTAIGAVILLAFAFFGEAILGLFGISLPALRIAGGIIVLLMGLQLLQSEMSEMAPVSADAAGADLRRSKIISPLAIPFLLGPGAITTIIIQCESVSTASGGLMVGAAVTIIALLVLLTLVAAQPLSRWLGTSGLTVAARIGGMIIAAIAIDMMITGIRNAFPGIA